MSKTSPQVAEDIVNNIHSQVSAIPLIVATCCAAFLLGCLVLRQTAIEIYNDYSKRLK